jgi:hypothetical protein
MGENLIPLNLLPISRKAKVKPTPKSRPKPPIIDTGINISGTINLLPQTLLYYYKYLLIHFFRSYLTLPILP